MGLGLNEMKMSLLFRVAIFVLCLSSGASGLAQRGGRYATFSPSAPQHTSGFPGFFDTEMVPAGGFTFDIPSFAADYGLNDRLTLGVNGLSLLGNTFGLTGGVLKARYLLFGKNSSVLALTTYGGGYIAGASQYVYLGAFTLNATFGLGSNQSVGGSLLALRLGARAGTVGQVDYTHLSGTSVLLAGRYRIVFGHTLSIEGLLGSFLVTSLDIDTSGASLSAQALGSASSANILGRVSFDLRFGQRFMLSPQIYLLGTGDNEVPVLLIPMINLAFKTR